MVTEALDMSLSAKRELLARIHGRYQRASRMHKTRLPDEFCAICGYHRKERVVIFASLVGRLRASATGVSSVDKGARDLLGAGNG